MPEQDSKSKTRPVAGEHQRGADKVARSPIKVEPTTTLKRKPAWIRAKSAANPAVTRLKEVLRENRLHTVCEEASCPNLGECFAGGTATFMIMGDICTRRCPFCDVAHGRPEPLDADEPENLAVFEAVHGSAPDIAGKNVTNPLAVMLSAEQMMRYLGEDHVANHIKHAVIVLLTERDCLTPDMGGKATTSELTEKLISEIVH